MWVCVGEKGVFSGKVGWKNTKGGEGKRGRGSLFSFDFFPFVTINNGKCLWKEVLGLFPLLDLF